ncbi:MAG: acyl-CoA dehydrogenase family protein [Acidobacteriota bacterium]
MSPVHRNVPDSTGVSACALDPDYAKLLRVYLDAELYERLEPHFLELGERVGKELEALALSADKNPPTLQVRSRSGAPEERVLKHPDFEALEQVAFGDYGLAAMSHRSGVLGSDAPLPPLVKYALVYLFVQVEFGLCCPLSMTDSLTRTLRKFGSQELIERYVGRLTSQDLDELFQGAMFMTEQEAGSDVGAIRTTARQDTDGTWRLWGDKWFCSNPDADLAMVLARPADGSEGTRGLSLFLLPRRLEDGRANAYRIVNLKDKLGSRSMASGEVVLEGAVAHLVGDPGAGFKQMTDMINMSRLANGVRSAGMMRRAVNESEYIAQNRVAFGRSLADLPLMRRQLEKMRTVAEQGRAMVFHTARVLEAADAGDETMRRTLRILTPLIKFRTCRDARKVTGDAMEVRGGVGYIEEWSDARLLRDSHLGSIWEGTSNIVALDVARAARREGALDALIDYLKQLLAEGVAPELRRLLDPLVHRSQLFFSLVAERPELEEEVRRAATGLYHVTSAVFLAWESARLERHDREAAAGRAELARAVVFHKLSRVDPLAPRVDRQPVPPAQR